MIRQRTPTPSSRAALALAATGGEYRLATLEQGLAKQFGVRMPLQQLIKDRQRRVNTLQLLCKKYNIQVPADTGSRLNIPIDWQSALRVEADLLLDNIRLYDQLQDLPGHHRDVERALWSLRQETLKVHLPLLFKRNPPPTQ